MAEKGTETLGRTRIVKNTLFLYTRTLIMMMLAMYSSRVTLDMLGATGYGTYMAIGGCIAMLSTINAGISSAISRFITFELGKQDQATLSKVFTTAFNVLLLLCVVLMLLAETVGLWYIDTHMQFSPDSQECVHLIFQLTLIGFLLGIATMPFMAILIAHEEFKYIATFGTIQAVSQFCLVMCISFLPNARLTWYAWSVFFTTVTYQLAFVYVCIRRHPQIRYRLGIDKSLFRQMLSFASFSYIGSSAGILREQGVTILFNTFFGVVCNAARGVSGSVLIAINSLASSFTTALSPQITKSYAAREYEYMWELVRNGIRYSFYLMLILAVPVLSSTEWLLSLWLKEVPPMAVNFTRLTIIGALCEILSAPLIFLMNATGKIALYQCIVGGTLLLTVPIDLILLHFGVEAEALLWVNIVISFALFFLRLALIKRVVYFCILKFIASIFLRVSGVLLFTLPFIYAVQHLFLTPMSSNSEKFACTILSFGVCCLTIYAVGVTKNERIFLHGKIKKMISVYR